MIYQGDCLCFHTHTVHECVHRCTFLFIVVHECVHDCALSIILCTVVFMIAHLSGMILVPHMVGIASHRSNPELANDAS